MDNESKSLDASDIERSPSALSGIKTEYSLEDYERINQAFIRASDEAIQLREEKEALQVKVTELKNSIHTTEILDSLIEPMAKKIFWFMCVYCGFIGALVIGALCRGELTEGVLRLLVGSTAVTVVGLVGTIVAGIFANARRRSG